MPEIAPPKVILLVLFAKKSVPLSTTLPTILPPEPSASVPALMVVPPL
ncbi:hypothetical protein DP49_5690 [Burkholderia pseudomallei]|nr:hypothetical protein DP49_5690 [Burkholderia pseudomallei]